jgi:hypothetical protein
MGVDHVNITSVQRPAGELADLAGRSRRPYTGAARPDQPEVADVRLFARNCGDHPYVVAGIELVTGKGLDLAFDATDLRRERIGDVKNSHVVPVPEATLGCCHITRRKRTRRWLTEWAQS